MPGVSFYLATLFAPSALFLIVLAFDDFWALVTFVLSEIAIIGLSLAMAPRIYLSKEKLSIGQVLIPTKLVSAITVIEKSQLQFERGPNLNPKAYIRFQVGVKGLLKVELKDPADPTPYWLISSRRPEVIAARFRKLSS